MLWSHQQEAISACREAFGTKRRVCLVMPTGSGKTRTGVEVARLSVARGRRVLWLAHRTELIEQACRTIYAAGLTVGAIAATSVWPPNLQAPIQVASVQTLLARDLRPPADIVIPDEAHHFGEGAQEWAALLGAYPEAYVLGMTATPERGDGSGLAPMFERLVLGPSVRQLTQRGLLVPCEVIRPPRMLEHGQIARHPLDAYREHTPGRRAIVFCKTVEQAQSYADDFVRGGTPAVCIHAKTNEDARSTALSLFARGTVLVITNVYVLTEGTDLPSAEVCVLARGASTAGIYIQMVGRVLRVAPNKSQAWLLDLRGVSHLWGPPEDERVYSLDGAGISCAAKECYCPVCGCLRNAGQGCASCGWEPGEAETEQTEITNDPLVRYARKIAESPEQRWETLVRWIDQHVEKGMNPQRVFWKWKAVYQEAIPDGWFHRALHEVLERRPDAREVVRESMRKSAERRRGRP